MPSQDLGVDGAFLLGEDVYFSDGTGVDLEGGAFSWVLSGTTMTIKYIGDIDQVVGTVEAVNSSTFILYVNGPGDLVGNDAKSYEQVFTASSKRGF